MCAEGDVDDDIFELMMMAENCLYKARMLSRDSINAPTESMDRMKDSVSDISHNLFETIAVIKSFRDRHITDSED